MLRERLAPDGVESDAMPNWLGGRRRWVSATVVVGGHEVDAFEASTQRSLTLELGPVLAQLPARDARIDYMGLSARWGLLGLRRRVEVTPLADRSQALAFLDGARVFAYPRPAVEYAVGLGATAQPFGAVAHDRARTRPRPRKAGQTTSHES